MRASVRRRALLSLLFVMALGLFAGSSCLSPTLPLPPPEEPDSMHAADGLWRISGYCDPGAIVTVFNERTGKGAIVEDRERLGRYTVEIEAELCDYAWATQDSGSESSTRVTFVIEEMTPSGPTDPGACP